MSDQAHTTTYRVTGMSCGHCRDAVTEELTELGDVTGVDVDLDAGTVTVTSTQEPNDADINAAIDEAGYELAGRVG